MTTSATEILNEIQRGLEQRGVIDVKMTFAPGFEKESLEDLKMGVARFLQAYLDGDGVPITYIDRPHDCEFENGSNKCKLCGEVTDLSD